MAGENRRGGTIYVRINGQLQDSKGDFSYNLGHPSRAAIIGNSSVHGYAETVQAAYIEGVVTDSRSLDLAAMVTAEDMTVTLELANGKTVTLSEAWFAGEGTVTTGEGEITVRWESRLPAQEV